MRLVAQCRCDVTGEDRRTSSSSSKKVKQQKSQTCQSQIEIENPRFPSHSTFHMIFKEEYESSVPYSFQSRFPVTTSRVAVGKSSNKKIYKPPARSS
jgi:hypothetical protein